MENVIQEQFLGFTVMNSRSNYHTVLRHHTFYSVLDVEFTSFGPDFEANLNAEDLYRGRSEQLETIAYVLKSVPNDFGV